MAGRLFEQRWRRGRDRWVHPDGPRFVPARYEVATIDEAQARPFIETHHYAHSYPAARFAYGLIDTWFDTLVGVAVYAVPVNAAVLTTPFPGLEPYIESIELSRLVLLDEVPFNAESWFVARCHHDLALGGIRGVVSFSDPLPRHGRDGTAVMPGHVGTVYQALNFVYTGRTRPHTVTVLPDGSVMHGRALAKIRAQHTGHRYAERVLEDLGGPAITDGDDPARWLRHALASIGEVNVRHPGNHRYCLTLGGRRYAWHLALTPHQRRPTRAAYQPELAALDAVPNRRS
jgi:hypothetical protein